MNHIVASVQLNLHREEVPTNVDGLYLLVPLYLCDQQELIEQEQVDVDQLCVLWEWTKTNTVRLSIIWALAFEMCITVLHTCEHQFPYMQQTSVRNEILQSDGLQEMLQSLWEKQSLKFTLEENTFTLDIRLCQTFCY